jgi:hypothetical protein
MGLTAAPSPTNVRLGKQGGRGLSTQQQLYDELAPGRHGPAFGAASPPPEEDVPESRGPLDRRTEAALGFAIVAPTTLGYVALVYGLYLALTAVL